jgi:hypothetical protein
VEIKVVSASALAHRIDRRIIIAPCGIRPGCEVAGNDCGRIEGTRAGVRRSLNASSQGYVPPHEFAFT